MSEEDDFHKQQTQSGAFQDNQSPPLAEVPRMIGPYKIEALLEKGGMSFLYLGIHPETQESTIIKVLSPKFLTHPDVTKRFLNEAEIIAMTDHPNIVKLYGHGEWEKGLYISMEYIRGISLRQALLQSPISLKKALEIIIDIAYALCHLHTHGVIHRDLKPENILITDKGEIKVIDFGISQILTERPASGGPAKQRVIGTPIYMSPEQREDPENVSYPSDIYSLGIIAYELVLGKLSHGQIHLSLMPKGLQKILNKTLQPNPKDRYQDVVDFITDISAYLNSTNLQKEKKVGDQLSELSENLRNAQQMLSPSKTPEWEGFELGLAFHKGFNIYGIYYEFFSFSNGSYGIVMGESSAKGAEGIIHTSILKGMIHSLRHLSHMPTELAHVLNQLVIEDKLDHFFSLSYLLLFPNENKLTFLSCGFENLWHIPTGSDVPKKLKANNVAIGIDPNASFREVSDTWQLNDRLILNSFGNGITEENTGSEFSDEFFETILHENAQSAPQKIVDTLLRKAKFSQTPSLYDRTIALLGILRTR